MGTTAGRAVRSGASSLAEAATARDQAPAASTTTGARISAPPSATPSIRPFATSKRRTGECSSRRAPRATAARAYPRGICTGSRYRSSGLYVAPSTPRGDTHGHSPGTAPGSSAERRTP